MSQVNFLNIGYQLPETQIQQLLASNNSFTLGFFIFCCRTNSDSALHQSTLTPAQQASFTGGSQELQPKRGNQHFNSHLCFCFYVLIMSYSHIVSCYHIRLSLLSLVQAGTVCLGHVRLSCVLFFCVVLLFVAFCCLRLMAQSRALQCMMKGFECGFEGRVGEVIEDVGHSSVLWI